MLRSTAQVAGTAAGAVVGGATGALGVGLVSKVAAGGSGLVASGLHGVAAATTGLTSALLATAPVTLPLAGLVVGGLGAYALIKTFRNPGPPAEREV